MEILFENNISGYNRFMKGEFEMYIEEERLTNIREQDLYVDYKLGLKDPYEAEAELQESFDRWANDMAEANDYYNG